MSEKFIIDLFINFALILIFIFMNLQQIIEQSWNDKELLKEDTTKSAIREIILQLDKGKLRVAEYSDHDGWKVNEWI